MQKWEFKAMFTKMVPTYNELNQLGREGWELVTVVGGASAMGSGYIAYFKRPLK